MDKQPGMTPRTRLNTKFAEKYGMTTHELAHQEGTTSTAINMRVHNWGTPWQRRAKPTRFEAAYGMTRSELCAWLGKCLSIVYLWDKEGTTQKRIQEHLKHNPDPPGPVEQPRQFWLHENHPDYHGERFKLFQKGS
jgi:hypothetical protein